MTGLTQGRVRGRYERYAPLGKRELGAELRYHHRHPSPLAFQLRSLLNQVAANDWQTIDELERVWADFSSGVQVQLGLDGGYRELDGWDRHGPGVRNHPAWHDWEYPEREGWLDHPYRLIRDRVTTYVSEPYHLTMQGIRALARLREQGWSIWITAKDARHFPGQSMAVYLTRRPQRGPHHDWFDRDEAVESSVTGALSVAGHHQKLERAAPAQTLLWEVPMP